jgi:hypothetical protein
LSLKLLHGRSLGFRLFPLLNHHRHLHALV